MSVVKSLLISLARRLRLIGKGMTREQAIAECESMRRILEFRGQSLLEEAKNFHARAAQYVKAGLLKLARAELTSWAEYRGEGEACLLLAKLLSRIKLRISRMKTVEEINAFGERISSFIDKTLERLPDNPMLAVRQLESDISIMDSMLGLEVEVTPSVEHEELVEAELRNLMASELAPEAAAPEVEAESGEVALTTRSEAKAEEAKRKLEELKRKLAEAGERA